MSVRLMAVSLTCIQHSERGRDIICHIERDIYQSTLGYKVFSWRYNSLNSIMFIHSCFDLPLTDFAQLPSPHLSLKINKATAHKHKDRHKRLHSLGGIPRMNLDTFQCLRMTVTTFSVYRFQCDNLNLTSFTYIFEQMHLLWFVLQCIKTQIAPMSSLP